MTLHQYDFVGIGATNIFCLDDARLTITNNTFTRVEGEVIAIDLINTDGSIDANTITGYKIALSLFSAPMLVDNNVLQNNGVAILIPENSDECPNITDTNSYINNDMNFDFKSNCVIPNVNKK